MLHMKTALKALGVCVFFALPLLLLFEVATAQSKNSFQEFQPFRGNYLARAGGGLTGYQYGWPSGGTSETGVVFQLLFDESSGNIVDEVSGTTLSAVGSATYGITATGLWSDVAPGITTGSAIDFYKSTATASMNVGASDDLVFEAIASTTATDPKYLFCMGPTFGSYSGFAARFYTIGGIFFSPFFKTDAGTLISGGFDISSYPYNDGNPHKYKVTVDRDGNLEAFFDGNLLGSSSAVLANGEVITSGFVRTGAYVAGFGWVGTIYEERLSIGADVLNNDSGGPSE